MPDKGSKGGKKPPLARPDPWPARLRAASSMVLQQPEATVFIAIAIAVGVGFALKQGAPAAAFGCVACVLYAGLRGLKLWLEIKAKASQVDQYVAKEKPPPFVRFDEPPAQSDLFADKDDL